MQVEYRCADGTAFPVTFESPEQAATSWYVDREHFGALTPLGDALERLGTAGCRRAYDEAGLPVPSQFRLGPPAHGFAYFCGEPPSPAEVDALASGIGRLLDRFGDVLALWRDHCLPRVVEACEQIAGAGDDVPLAALCELQHYALHMTMVPALACRQAMQLLSRSLEPIYGERARLLALELAQGTDNDTLRADQALWELGRLADREVIDALADPQPAAAMTALRAGGRSAAFFGALDRFLAEFGGRAEGWDIGCPTWREQRDGFWKQVRHMAAPDVAEPRQATQKAAARRESLVAEIEARLAGDEAALARFRAHLGDFHPYVEIKEARARWQTTAIGALRVAALRRGRRLVERGLLDDDGDVLYLLPDEVEHPDGAADLRALVARRRAEHEWWRHRVPPEVIGGGAPIVAQPVEGAQLVGIAAARGVVTARARVVRDLADGDRLGHGDVLVCVMTSPAWTPLLAIASAVVVDSGDIVSHPAIAAREYGIPCVLGTGTATAAIPDGALVTVDGFAGTVQLREPPAPPSL